MTSAARIFPEAMTIETFLAFLDGRPKHERWDLISGEPVLMARPTLRHAVLSGSLMRALYPLARKRGCQVVQEMLVGREGKEGFTAAPDLLVYYGKISPTDRLITIPSIIVEILSPTTMRYDRGIKLGEYRDISTVEQIILVYQDQIRVESWTRSSGPATDSSDNWDLETLVSRTTSVPLPTLSDELPVARIYEDVPELS